MDKTLSSSKPKTISTITTNQSFIPVDEIEDPKWTKKRAHKSISPKYKDGELVGYFIGDWTESYRARLTKEEEEKSKK